MVCPVSAAGTIQPFTEYEGKRVIVTGASSGIGLATAKALVELGAEVHGLSRKAPEIDLASFISLDLGEEESVIAAVQQVGGHVDAVFNCAGATPMLPSLDILKVNFLGTRLLTERLIPLMGEGGAIVNVSSDGGYAWRKQLPLILEFLKADDFDAGVTWYEENEAAAGHAYAFSKAALNVWTMAQSQTLIKEGIRINISSPGAVQTPMLEAIEAVFPPELIAATEEPSGRRSSPEEQVGPLLFLNSSSASYVNGGDLAIDGGYWAKLSTGGSLW